MANAVRVDQLDGTNGFIVEGLAPYDLLGASVSHAGDLNGDGYDDVIIGAPGPFWAPVDDRSGQAYVIFGRKDGLPAVFDLKALDGTNGFRLVGVPDAADPTDEDPVRLGSAVSPAGDFNGDGFDDIVIGAPELGLYSGAVHVVFGKKTPFDATIDVTSLDGVNGFNILSDDELGFGAQINEAGDVNADGFDDFIVTSRGDSLLVASAFLVPGTDERLQNGPDDSLFISDLDLVRFSRNVPYDAGPLAASGAGDINGDGFDDLVFGDSRGGTFNTAYSGRGDPLLLPPFAGIGYLVFGSADPQSVALDDLDGTNGFKIPGLNGINELGYGDEVGSDVARIGDVNGDGIDDFMIGARGNTYDLDATPGPAIYVIFGTEDGFPDELDLAALDATTGFGISRVIDDPNAGLSISPAGDFDGDGLADMLSGLTASFSGPVTVHLANGERFFVGDSGYQTAFGSSLDTAGDFNGDGLADIIIGAPAAGEPREDLPFVGDQRGKAYVVFGRPDEASSALPPLVEGEAIPAEDLARLAGVDPAALTLGPAADAAIIFTGELAKFKNSVGVYVIGENGELEDPHILFANTEKTEAGTTIHLADTFGPDALEAGDRIGLFAIANGAKKNPASNLDTDNGSFAFIDPITKEPATIDTPAPTLVFTQTFGSARQIKGNIFHTADPDPADPLTNALNDGGEVQLISAIDSEGDLEIRFEDKSLAGRSDRDFNDVLLTVSSNGLAIGELLASPVDTSV